MGGHHHRRTVLGQPGQGGGERALRGVVEAAGRFVEQHQGRGAREHDRQHQRQPLPLGEVPGVPVAGDPGHQPVEHLAAGAGPDPGAVIRGRTLLVHGLEVEQVVGVLRHQPDASTAGCGVQPGGVGTGDRDPAGRTSPGALERPQQRRLPGAVAAHHRADPAGAHAQVHLAEHHPLAAGHAEPGGGEHLVADARVRRGRPGGQHHRAGPAPGLAHRDRQRCPAQAAAELDDRRHHRRDGQHVGGQAHLQRPVAGHQHHPVGERDHPLQPVLGDQDGEADVVDQPGQGGQHLLGRGRVQRGGRFVENQQPGVHREHRPDRHPLLLPAGEGPEVAGAQLGDAEQVEGLLDPAAHRRGRQAQLLHPVGELLLHRVSDEAGGRVLPDVPDRVHPLAWRQVQDALAVEQQVTAQLAAGEPRHQAREHPEQRRLPGAGRPGDHHQLALIEVEADAREHRAVVIRQPRVAQRDHRGAHAASPRAAGGAQAAPPRAMPAARSTAGLSTGSTATPG